VQGDAVAHPACAVADGGKHVGQRHRTALDVRAGVGAGEQQQIADQRGHTVGFGGRSGDGAGPELRVIVAEPAEQVHRAAHPGQRRAQFVRAVGQELAQPLVGPVE